jgi:HK97 family phage major capsid protein
MVDLSRQTSGVNLPPEVSNKIWQVTQEQSGVMRAATQIPLPGRGLTIPIITGDPVAAWTAETVEKPVSRGTLSSKTMQGYTLAVIEPFSNQFRRDLPSLYQALVSRLPLALAKQFDQTVFGLAGGAPGSNFDTLGAATAIGIAGKTYNGLVAAQSAVATATGDGELNGWVMSPAGSSVLVGATDTQNRPLFAPTGQALGPNGIPDIFGAPVYKSRAVYLADADGAGAGTDKQYGYAGDWNQAFYGTVEGIQVSISEEATLNDGGTSLNLWQRNMFAVRAEIEVGFRIRDIAYFTKLTSAVQA